MDLEEGGDGSFWMPWEAFSGGLFDSITVCRYFEAGNWHRVCLRSAWAGKNGQGVQPEGYGRKGLSREERRKQALETKYKMTFSPQFTLKVSHVGSIFLELMLEDDMRAHPDEDFSNITIYLYDWKCCQPQFSRGDAGMVKKDPLKGPVVAFPTSTQNNDWGAVRSLQLEVQVQEPIPSAGKEYVLAAHRWDLAAEPVTFTITAWYKPQPPVPLLSATLEMKHAEAYSYKSKEKGQVDVDFTDLAPFQQDMTSLTY